MVETWNLNKINNSVTKVGTILKIILLLKTAHNIGYADLMFVLKYLILNPTLLHPMLWSIALLSEWSKGCIPSL